MEGGPYGGGGGPGGAQQQPPGGNGDPLQRAFDLYSSYQRMAAAASTLGGGGPGGGPASGGTNSPYDALLYDLAGAGAGGAYGGYGADAAGMGGTPGGAPQQQQQQQQTMTGAPGPAYAPAAASPQLGSPAMSAAYARYQPSPAALGGGDVVDASGFPTQAQAQQQQQQQQGGYLDGWSGAGVGGSDELATLANCLDLMNGGGGGTAAGGVGGGMSLGAAAAGTAAGQHRHHHHSHHHGRHQHRHHHGGASGQHGGSSRGLAAEALAAAAGRQQRQAHRHRRRSGSHSQQQVLGDTADPFAPNPIETFSGHGQSTSNAATTTSTSTSASASAFLPPHSSTAAHSNNSAIPTRGNSPPTVPNSDSDPTTDALSTFTLSVPNLSPTPLTAVQVLETINSRTDEVVTLFLPCVDFLVSCQQELRAGLAAATKKRLVGGGRGYRDAMTPRQFYNQYVAPLPSRFFRQNQPIMPLQSLQGAFSGIQTLCHDAKRAEIQGCEAMKNTFLGGMREGRSWGLRQWLSKNGGALSICNDLELILGALRKLNKSAETTVRLAEIIRPRAKLVFDRLKADVPAAYQEHSSAHPYLPFFHRLEGAVKALATFDPEDDDVVCIDDDSDIEEVTSGGGGKPPPAADNKAQKPPAESRRSSASSTASNKRKSSGGGFDAPGIKIEAANQKRVKREDSGVTEASSISGLGFDSAFDRMIAGLAEDGGSSAGGGSERCTPTPMGGERQQAAATAKAPAAPQVVDLLESDDENDDEAGPAPAAPTDAAAVAAGAAKACGEDEAEDKKQASSSSTSPQEQRKQQAQGWRCTQCTYMNSSTASRCVMCDDDDDTGSQFSGDMDIQNAFQQALGAMFDPSAEFFDNSSAPAGTTGGGGNGSSGGDGAGAGAGSGISLLSRAAMASDDTSKEVAKMVLRIDDIAKGFDSNMHYMLRPVESDPSDYWSDDDRYMWILQLLKTVLQQPESHRHVNPVDETELFLAGGPQYSSVIRHPLCFKDIVSALTESSEPGMWGRGKLKSPSLDMWRGKDLLEAIDLVLLNSLAYYGKEKSDVRKDTNKLRKMLWSNIEQKAGHNKKAMPVKRKVSSGYVIVKSKKP